MGHAVRERAAAPWQPGEFAQRVVAWQRSHGRRDLPWQGMRDPYRVWLSEIMLQQTQVQTVAPYYERFVARFPTVQALAAAPLDEVLSLWSGLGYYARARHLHECAQAVVARCGGEFPQSADELERLPGIGRSTAAAIAAFCFDERAAILDGNVKRVLARAFGLSGDLGNAAAQRSLWQRAHDLLPPESARDTMPAYTQGLMDLGATICVPRAPRCAECPLADRCVAAAEGDPERYPRPRERAAPRAVSWWLLHAVDPADRCWLVRRPASGIWARLYCLPVFPSREALLAALAPDVRAQAQDAARIAHGLTHRALDLHVVQVRLSAGTDPGVAGTWFDPAAWPGLGLPAPIRRYLASDADLFTSRPARDAA